LVIQQQYISKLFFVLQNMLRQKEAELKQANAELEERGKLLYKTKVCSSQATVVPSREAHAGTGA
jgi:hypothetical protein